MTVLRNKQLSPKKVSRGPKAAKKSIIEEVPLSLYREQRVTQRVTDMERLYDVVASLLKPERVRGINCLKVDKAALERRLDLRNTAYRRIPLLIQDLLAKDDFRAFHELWILSDFDSQTLLFIRLNPDEVVIRAHLDGIDITQTKERLVQPQEFVRPEFSTNVSAHKTTPVSNDYAIVCQDVAARKLKGGDVVLTAIEGDDIIRQRKIRNISNESAPDINVYFIDGSSISYRSGETATLVVSNARPYTGVDHD
ncbi:hypothetical protein fHeYen902_212 [Yersinia phage fHe-Yen9-02]|nr:hypothetical protein fHeYen902_212 [Yersinia phage fHe-Yen9-02]